MNDPQGGGHADDPRARTRAPAPPWPSGEPWAREDPLTSGAGSTPYADPSAQSPYLVGGDAYSTGSHQAGPYQTGAQPVAQYQTGSYQSGSYQTGGPTPGGAGGAGSSTPYDLPGARGPRSPYEAEIGVEVQPGNGQPTYGQPSGDATYGQATYGQASYGQPTYGPVTAGQATFPPRSPERPPVPQTPGDSGYGYQAYGEQPLPAADYGYQAYGEQPLAQRDYGHQAYGQETLSPGNGAAPNGLANGHSSNGQSSNGYSGNGYSGNGYSGNGRPANGYAPNGYAPNGQAPNGYAPNGQAPNGYAPNGQAPNGHVTGAHAVNGLGSAHTGGFAPPGYEQELNGGVRPQPGAGEVWPGASSPPRRLARTGDGHTGEFSNSGTMEIRTRASRREAEAEASRRPTRERKPARGRGRPTNTRHEPQTPAQTAVSAVTEVVLVLGMALVLSLVIKTFLVQAFLIPSQSMQDTLQVQDRVLVTKLTPGPLTLHRGDVVVFKDPGGWLTEEAPKVQSPIQKSLTKALTFVGLLPQDAGQHLIKRVIGVGGDRVVCCDATGRIQVNGTPIDEAYVRANNKPSEKPFDVTIKPGFLWVMGDNRSQSWDSRFHPDLKDAGQVPMENVVGKAFVIVWPFSRFGGVNEPPEVFARVPDTPPPGQK